MTFPPPATSVRLYKATVAWTLYTVQKNLLEVGAVGNAHNFLRLVDPTGRVVTEVHGTYTNQFTLLGPVPANYLRVTHTRPFGFRNDLKNVSSNATIEYKSNVEAVGSLRRAFINVAGFLDRTEMLYVGVKFFWGRATNSNSVWRTMLTELGVKDDPLAYSGGLATPGDRTDLATAASNNEQFEKARNENPPKTDVFWTANPGYESVIADRYLPPETQAQ